MRVMKKQVNTSAFVPDYTATSLQDVDFAALKKRGVQYVAFDADSTLVHFRETALSPETNAFLRKQRRLFKGWCIASNRLPDNLSELGKSIDAPVVRAHGLVRKPRRKFFQRVISLFEAKPEQVAMIGDKLLADIWGANRSGMVTVWVEHLGPDNPLDRLLRTRSRERRILHKYSKS